MLKRKGKEEAQKSIMIARDDNASFVPTRVDAFMKGSSSFGTKTYS